MVKSDAGTEYTLQEFEQFCADKRVAVSFAPPKHQEGNHFAERTWQSLRKLARCMLVHARLPDMYLYHALLHAYNVFNILPLKVFVTADGTVSTPFELFVGSKPMVSHFKVFGCPCIAMKWTTSVDGKPEDNSKGTQRGIRGLHFGFSPTQKGLILYIPSTRQIVISGDVICDETFASTVTETWRPFHDALAFRSIASFIPDSYTVLEHTGDLLFQFEEGNATAHNNQTATTSPFEEDSSIQTSSQTLLRILVKRRLLKAQRKTMRKQTAQILFLRLLMMGWIPTLGGPTELGTHQNF